MDNEIETLEEKRRKERRQYEEEIESLKNRLDRM